MGGAYVSKPDAAPTVDVPEGWNPIWPRPEDLADPTTEFAPYPPGYTAVYSGVVGGTSSMDYDGTTSTTFNLYDHGTYPTNDPSGSQITWSATVGGVAVGIRLTGEAAYSSSVVTSYSHLGGSFWGGVPQFEFDLSEGDAESNLVLTAQSSFEGQEANDSYIIAINALAVGVLVFGTVTRGGSPVVGADVAISTSFGFPLIPTAHAETDEIGYFEYLWDFEDVEGRTFNVAATDTDSQDSGSTGPFGPATAEGQEIDAGTIAIKQVASATVTFYPSFTGSGSDTQYSAASVTTDAWGSQEPQNRQYCDGAYTNVAAGQAPLDQAYQGGGVGLLTWDNTDCSTLAGDIVQLKVTAGVGSTWTGRCAGVLDYMLDGVTAYSDTTFVEVAAGSPSADTATTNWFTISEDLQTITIH